MASDRKASRDFTAQNAVSNVAGESLVAAVLSKVPDELDRTLLVAHVALGLPLASIARRRGLVADEAAARVTRALAALQADAELAAELDGVRHAGARDSYHTLIFAFRLTEWFCSHCGDQMIQRGTGRPRRTCNARCRVRLHRAGGTSWKDQYQDPPPARRPAYSSTASSPAQVRLEPHQPPTTEDDDQASLARDAPPGRPLTAELTLAALRERLQPASGQFS